MKRCSFVVFSIIEYLVDNTIEERPHPVECRPHDHACLEVRSLCKPTAANLLFKEFNAAGLCKLKMRIKCIKDKFSYAKGKRRFSLRSISSCICKSSDGIKGTEFAVPVRRGPGFPCKNWSECIKKDIFERGLSEARQACHWWGGVYASRLLPKPETGSTAAV